MKEVCPDLVFGVICGDCNAEGFVVANFLLARSGLSGEANTESIPVAVLRIMASSFFAYPTMTPFEDMIWAFGASTYTSEQITNGCEIRAWNILQKEKYFKRLETWYPKSLTRTGERSSLFIRMPLNRHSTSGATGSISGGERQTPDSWED